MMMHAKEAGLRNHLRPWLFLFAGVALVLLVVLFYAEEDWRGSRAWERYRRAALARGEPVTVADLVPPPVPDDQNFAMAPWLEDFMTIRGGTDFLKEFGAASSALKTPKVVPLNSWNVSETDLEAWAEAFRVTRSNGVQRVSRQSAVTTPRAPAAEAVLSALSIYDPMVEELRAASGRPSSRFNLQYNTPNPAGLLLPHLARVKVLCQMLQLRASAELAAGKSDAALGDIHLALRVADSLRDEPILISQLVRIACVHLLLRPVAEGLANHSWSDGQLAGLADRLGQFDFCAAGYRAMLNERAFQVGVIEYVRDAPNRFKALDGIGSSSGAGSFDPRGALLAAVPRGWFYFEQLNSSEMIDSAVLPAFDLAQHQFLVEKCREGEQRIDSLLSGNRFGIALRHRLFSGLMLPALSRTVQKCAFAQAAVDSSLVGCGLERFRLANGAFPESLRELEPKQIRKLPRDVITGGPLKYSRTRGEPYVLYSVGWNQTDDGGVVNTNKSGLGIDLRNEERGGGGVSGGGDWVWRLPAGK